MIDGGRNNDQVIVIGAGASGLAVANALRARAIPVRIIEKARRAGEAWHHRHPQLRLNTHRDLSQLPGMVLPAGIDPFPSRDDITRYLTEYARQLNTPIDYGVTATCIERSDGNWTIQSDSGVYTAHHVVIATGLDRVPFTPDWPGRESFSGEFIHAADFGDVDNYRGKKVLVVGCGNSGSDILNHLSTIVTESLKVSVRHGPVVFPKRLYGIRVQRLSPVLARLPVPVVDRLLALTEVVAFGNLRKWGLPRHLQGGATRLVEGGIAPAIDDGFVQALKSGRIEIVPAIRQFKSSTIELIDGSCVQADVVIAATGYRTGLETLIGNTGVLDDSGTPVINGAQQLDSCRGLWLTGMRPRLPGFFYMACKTSAEIAAAIAVSRDAGEPSATCADALEPADVVIG